MFEEVPTMAIQGIEQPSVISIDAFLRLRKFDGVYDFALEWYQDAETECIR